VVTLDGRRIASGGVQFGGVAPPPLALVGNFVTGDERPEVVRLRVAEEVEASILKEERALEAKRRELEEGVGVEAGLEGCIAAAEAEAASLWKELILEKRKAVGEGGVEAKRAKK
jgi:hypothetical protein